MKREAELPVGASSLLIAHAAGHILSGGFRHVNRAPHGSFTALVVLIFRFVLIAMNDRQFLLQLVSEICGQTGTPTRRLRFEGLKPSFGRAKIARDRQI